VSSAVSSKPFAHVSCTTYHQLPTNSYLASTTYYLLPTRTHRQPRRLPDGRDCREPRRGNPNPNPNPNPSPNPDPNPDPDPDPNPNPNPNPNPDQEYGITREVSDGYAISSQQKWAAAL
jgi:hypothetical protein